MGFEIDLANIYHLGQLRNKKSCNISRQTVQVTQHFTFSLPYKGMSLKDAMYIYDHLKIKRLTGFNGHLNNTESTLTFRQKS